MIKIDDTVVKNKSDKPKKKTKKQKLFEELDKLYIISALQTDDETELN